MLLVMSNVSVIISMLTLRVGVIVARLLACSLTSCISLLDDIELFDNFTDVPWCMLCGETAGAGAREAGGPFTRALHRHSRE